MALTELDLLRRMGPEMDAANDILDECETVPWFAWCALVAQWSGIPTCLPVEGIRGGQTVIVGIGRGTSYGRGNIRYDGWLLEKPIDIAKRGSRWDVASGGNMAQWILLLDNEDEREDCLRANHSYAEGQRDISPEELAANRERVLRMTRGLMGHMERQADSPPLQIVESDDMRELRQVIARQRAEIELLRK